MSTYWHVYPREQIKPGLVGDGVCALGIPPSTEAPLHSFVGGNLRHNRIAHLPGMGQHASVLTYPYGIIFEGVEGDRIEAIEEPEAMAEAAGFEVVCYNQRMIARARNLFLVQPFMPEGVDALTFCLLQGLTHLLPSFSSFARIPVSSLHASTRQRGILVVEDEECQRKLFRVLLEQMGYCNIQVAQDGSQALPILQARGSEIDLILLNYRMPRMNGLELMRHLADHSPHTVAVIMVSGDPDPECRREFFRLGTSSVAPIDYVDKPFRLEEFRLEVRVAMEYMHRRRLRRS
jgi:CheY-like chemotaxis protein